MQQPAIARLASWGRFRGRGIGTDPRRLAELGRALWHELHTERARWPLWNPVCFGIGILVYFTLPSEPAASLLAVLALGVAAAVAGARRHRDGLPLLAWTALAFVLAGFATAQLRTLSVDAPVLPRASVYNLEGTILTAEPRGDGQRLLLGDLVIERLNAAMTPARVRFTVRSVEPPLLPGQRIRARVRLQPPSGALVPGGFDFARKAFFERLGGVGFAYGTPEVVAGEADLSPRLVSRLRFAIADRAERVIGGASGAVAAALLTGLRAAIPSDVWRHMQVAGLAHLLAISGLHMTLVAGTVFVVCRLLFSLWPAIALRVVPKKPAACLALLAAFAYLLLAGATVPTQRAFMMAGVALLAVLVDRNPISMRLLAYAALLVLVLSPESLLGPSFQMSFAAVVCLVAFYESRTRQPADAPPTKDPLRLGRLLVLYFLGVLLTTAIASLATTPFAAYHFQRVATYGALANLVAVPLTAFWIMPAGLLALLLMPFGLDGPVLGLMGAGIDLVLALAAFAETLPGAAVEISPWPPSSLVLIGAGGLWLCLWQRPWRKLGLVACGLGLLVALASRTPDLVIDRRGDIVVLRLDGTRHLLERNRDNWVRDQLVGSVGGGETRPFESRADGRLRCDNAGCVVTLDAGGPIVVALSAEAAVEDCRRAAFAILLEGAEACSDGTPSLGRRQLWRSAGAALYLQNGRIRVATVTQSTGDRPWAR